MAYIIYGRFMPFLIMKKLLITLLGILTMSSSILAAEGWITDYTQGVEEAKKSNKNMMVLFTGSDWCIWCKRLHSEILVKDEFTNFAKDNLILVELDFPAKNKSPFHTRKGDVCQKRKQCNSSIVKCTRADSAIRLSAPCGAHHGGGTVRDSHPASLNKCLPLLCESVIRFCSRFVMRTKAARMCFHYKKDGPASQGKGRAQKSRRCSVTAAARFANGISPCSPRRRPAPCR